MELTQEQFSRIEKYLPVQRGNVKMDHYPFLQALLYMIENGGKWRRLPRCHGKWNSVCQRASRWAKSGTMERVFNALQKEHVLAVKIEILALDSTSIKVHPDAHGALKKTGGSPSASQGADGTPSFMWYPLMTRLS